MQISLDRFKMVIKLLQTAIVVWLDDGSLKDLICVKMDIITWLSLDLKLLCDELYFPDSKHNSLLHSFLELMNYNFSLDHSIQEISNSAKKNLAFMEASPGHSLNIMCYFCTDFTICIVFTIRYGRLNCRPNTSYLFI